MNFLRPCASVIIILSIPSFVAAQEPQKFDLKFELGKSLFQKRTTTVKQQIKVMGQDLAQTQTSTFYSKLTPLRKVGDSWVIEYEIEGIQMSIDISGNKIDYDSTKPEDGSASSNPGLMGFLTTMIGAKLTVTLDKYLKVEKVEGVQEFIKKISSANSQNRMDEVMKAIMTDDAVKQMVDPTLGMLPETPKHIGETWSSSSTLNLGPIGSYSVTYNFRYVGIEKQHNKIEVDSKLEYKAPKEMDSTGLLFRIKEGNLTSEPTEKGIVLYNPRLGIIESADITLKIKGVLTVTIGMTDTKVELQQTQNSICKCSDISSLHPLKTKDETPDSSLPPATKTETTSVVACQSVICQPMKCCLLCRVPCLRLRR
jgi:hypothetical protein